MEVRFAMHPRLARGFNDSVAVERGPLVFSYPIGEVWVKLRERGMTADWQVYPTTPWNYALAAGDGAAEAITVQESAVGAAPFSLKGTPVKLQVNARQLTSWRAVDGVADAVPLSPVASDQPESSIKLVPYAAAKLRITSFPQLQGTDVAPRHLLTSDSPAFHQPSTSLPPGTHQHFTSRSPRIDQRLTAAGPPPRATAGCGSRTGHAGSVAMPERSGNQNSRRRPSCSWRDWEWTVAAEV